MRAGDTLFVADLHLDPSRPAVTALALRFLARARSRDVAALWILGDLFEAWLGDDMVDPAHEPVLDALAALAGAGVAVHLMHGNRDFLIGADLAARLGAELHPEDERIVALEDGPVLLLHGDTLCTADTAYLALRRTLREPLWQERFLALSPAERLAEARALREGSREATAAKARTIMDVEAGAVAAAFARSGCETLIHGHTHRPDDHREPSGRRVVVGDWRESGARYARHDGERLELALWR